MEEWIILVASFLLVILFPSLLLWLVIAGKTLAERKRSRSGPSF